MTGPPYPLNPWVLSGSTWEASTPWFLKSGAWTQVASGSGGSTPPPPGGAGLFGVTTFMGVTGLTPDQATQQWDGDPAGAYPGANVNRLCLARKDYPGTNGSAGAGASYSNGTGYTGTNKLFFPQVADEYIQACIDLQMTLFICYLPAFNPPTTADATAIEDSLSALLALNVPNINAIIYQEVEHQPPTAAEYFAALVKYRPAVNAALGPGHLFHDASASYSHKWGEYFPGPPNHSTALVDGAGIDFYGQSFAPPPVGNSIRLNTPVSGNTLSYLDMCATAGVPFSGVFESGVSIGTHTPPANSVITKPSNPSDTSTYLGHILDCLYPGAYFMWYQSEKGNEHNVIPGYASGGVYSGSTGPNCIPALQAINDLITS